VTSRRQQPQPPTSQWDNLARSIADYYEALQRAGLMPSFIMTIIMNYVDHVHDAMIMIGDVPGDDDDCDEN
jgi:hypothetical protein